MTENNFLEQEEKRLLEKYDCSNIKQVLVKQRKILEGQKEELWGV